MSPDTIAMIEGLSKLGAMICITSEDGQFYVAIVYEAIGSARADTIDTAFAEAKQIFQHDLEARYHARKARAA